MLGQRLSATRHLSEKQQYCVQHTHKKPNNMQACHSGGDISILPADSRITTLKYQYCTE